MGPSLSKLERPEGDRTVPEAGRVPTRRMERRHSTSTPQAHVRAKTDEKKAVQSAMELLSVSLRKSTALTSIQKLHVFDSFGFGEEAEDLEEEMKEELAAAAVLADGEAGDAKKYAAVVKQVRRKRRPQRSCAASEHGSLYGSMHSCSDK